MTGIRLRPVVAADARLLWEWANDPVVRANSFHSEPIEWNSHSVWLARKLSSLETRIWIAEVDERAIGQIRYDREDDYAEIGFSISSTARGRGYGGMVLRISTVQACRELDVKRLVGLVKRSNIASMRAFESAGYRQLTSLVRDGEPCVRFELTCSEVSHG